MPNAQRFDAIIVGAGAAGMMCAARAGRRGRRVLLIDHYHKLGEKIRISGGGRCNFTNRHSRPENFLSQNPHFCRSALARYTPQHFIALVEEHRIAYHEKTAGQLFCDGSSQQIIDMLRQECDAAGVEWRMPCRIDTVRRGDEEFVLTTSVGEYRAMALVVATGGLTVAKIGASPFGYRLAAQFGLAVVRPRPALVPLSLDAETLAYFGDLAGVALFAEVACNGGRFRENVLLTHRGLSGPAILQISSYWRGGDAIEVNLLPDRDALAWLASERTSRKRLAAVIGEVLPKRFALKWCEARQIDQPVEQLSAAALREAAAALHRWRVVPSGTLGYNKAEVTLGGVDTDGLSSKTMEAKTVPGLYFIGEAVDVTGHLGGHNFQWAWASGHAAGEAV